MKQLNYIEINHETYLELNLEMHLEINLEIDLEIYLKIACWGSVTNAVRIDGEDGRCGFKFLK